MGSIKDEGDAGRVQLRPLQPCFKAMKVCDRGVSVDILGGSGIVPISANSCFDPGFVLHHRPYTLL